MRSLEDLKLPTRNGRSPDLVVSDEEVRDFGRLRAARASQGEINDAFKGLPGKVVKTARGERVDYPNVPLKDSSGKLNKYGKRLLDMHRRSTRIEREISQKWGDRTQKVEVVDGKGARHSIPERLADSVCRVRGLKPVKKRMSGSAVRCYAVRDGRMVELVRSGGKVLEVPA